MECDLRDGGDDPRAACCAEQCEFSDGGGGDEGGHGREGAFAGGDVIRGGRAVAELVRVGRDGEVVHLVVEDDAAFGDHDAGAEVEVDGCGEGDGEAGGVGGGDLRGAVAMGVG